VTVLRQRERDIALAAYDGDAAADAIFKLTRSIHTADAATIGKFLSQEAQALHEYGRDRGSNVHLVAAIALRREQLALAASDDERGAAFSNLGIALRRWATGKAGPLGSRRRLRPTARRWRRRHASGSLSNRLIYRAISAMRSPRSVSGRAARRAWKRRSRPIVWRWRSGRASGFRSAGL
jgi:hypothetical protein